MLRDATFSLPPERRRWNQLPESTSDLIPLLRQMMTRGEIAPLPKLPRLYEVTAPYAQQGPLDEREILFEAHPYAVLSHLSAMVFHGITNDLPKGLTASFVSKSFGELLPTGTRRDDWDEIEPPRGQTPPAILGRPVTWTRIRPERFFGFEEYVPLGYPVRYTMLERTLIDGLDRPDLCGGISSVLRAWVLSRDRLNLQVTVQQVERLQIAVMRQRAGFVLDQLGLSHPAMDRWASSSHRGGSSRLVGAAPFAPCFSEKWNLSLNGPVDVLRKEAF